MAIYTLCCDRCGDIFEGEENELLCENCRAEKPRLKKGKHLNEISDEQLSRKMAEYRRRAAASACGINDILRLAELNGISYGQAVARQKEGKL